ncbi:MAG: hypothetical protein KF851_14835 [Pirellulaceae bacterium]|nr:hypothetical protein [Pirellulaceae bacterium]
MPHTIRRIAARKGKRGYSQFVVDGVVGQRRDFAELVDGLQGPPRSVGEGTGRVPVGVYRAGFEHFVNKSISR